MDVGRALLTQIIDEDDLNSVLNVGVRADWFEDKDQRKIYLWIKEYFDRYGETPTDEVLSHQFPTFRLSSNPPPYDYCVDRFVEQRTRVILMDAIIEANQALDLDNQKDAQSAFSKALLRVGTEVTPIDDSNAIKTLRDRFEFYREHCKNAGKLRGVTTGFSTLDTITGGFQPEQFILFGGFAKQCKSWVLMTSAFRAHGQGKTALFVTFEMSVFEQLCRFDALAAGINANSLLYGRMKNDDWRKLKKGMSLVRGLRPFIITADLSRTMTLSGLAGKIEQHQPDIVYVDGCYLMDNEVGAEPFSTQAYTSISRGLKRLAQRKKIPIVCTTQALTGKARDGRVTMHSLGWTSAWSQDADLIMGVEKPEKTRIIDLRVVGARNVAPRDISVSCNFEESIFEECDTDEEDDDDD
jgi:replicative DNA helicase